MKNLRDKWVLITGAASGIGRCLALEFARRGSNIILADVNVAGMAAAGEIAALGVKTICIQADMSRKEDVEMLARRAVDEAGRVDVLVNNAGIAMVCETADMSIEEWERILAINLRGPILLIHYLLPHLLERGSGHIVNIASMAGLVGIPGMVPYTVTKFGMVGLSESLRAELCKKEIGVTAVCPGIVDTPIVKNSPIRGFKEKDMREPPDAIMIKPERAAREIVNGVVGNKAVVIPATMLSRFLYLVKKIFPGLGALVIRKGYQTWDREPVEKKQV